MPPRLTLGDIRWETPVAEPPLTYRLPIITPLPADEDEEHFWCCRRDVALCGAELAASEADEDQGDLGDPDLCEACRWLSATGARCPVPLCRLRYYLWGRWFS